MVSASQQDLLAFQSTPSVPLRIDPKHRRIWITDQPLYVSYKEFIFLSLLNQYYVQGQPCPRDLLCQRIYFDEVKLFEGREERLDCLVTRLRQKLMRISGQPIRIETIHKVGYQLYFADKSLL